MMASKKLKILILTPLIPYPPNQGNKIDIWNQIKWFSQHNCEVVIGACIEESSNESRHVDTNSDLGNYALYRLEYSVTDKGSISQSKQLITDWISIEDPEVLLVQYAKLQTIIPKNIGNSKIWFRSHNFELGHRFEKNIETKPWGKWKGLKAPIIMMFWLQSIVRSLSSVARQDYLLQHRAEVIMYIGVKDKEIMSNIYRSSACKVWIPPMLRLEEVPVKRNKKVLDIFYPGSHFSNNVNKSGAKILIDRIIPLVREMIPGRFRFHIIGKLSNENYGHNAADDLFIHDYIDDLDSFINEMDATCLPIRLGWGCKLKMIESLARGLPVIGDPIVFRGIPSLDNTYWACESDDEYLAAFKELQDISVRKARSTRSKDAYYEWKLEAEKNLLKLIQQYKSSSFI
jgi:hypothetical protein